MSRIPLGPVLFDSSAYIRFFREGAYPWLASDGELFQRTILSAVVAAELYAGTRSPEEKVQLDRLCLAHEALGNFSSPIRESWLQAGLMMGRYARRYGSLRAADHFRDVLIALEAVENAATLMTENARDFLRWQRLLLASGKRLKMVDLRRLA